MAASKASSRPRSNPGSDKASRGRVRGPFLTTADDMWMPPTLREGIHNFTFRTCSMEGCTTTSAFSMYDATTLRCGMEHCTKHTTPEEIATKAQAVNMNPNMVVIFYDVEVTRGMEMSQLAARTADGDHINTVIKTSTRDDSSPLINSLPPVIRMMLATEPRVAMERFIAWVAMIVSKTTNSTGSERDVVMVAHNGMCHDHVVLLKTMMSWGVNPPKWRFSDTLPIFKIVLRPRASEKSDLATLVHVYTPWFMHMRHDALSDATALKFVVTAAVEGWALACYVFSTSCDDLITSIGLDMFRVREPLPFPSTPMG